MEKLRQVGKLYCQGVLGIRPEFSRLNPTALTMLHLSSLIHVLRHKSIIEGYPLPTEGPAIVTGNHRAEGDNSKLYMAARRSNRLIRAVIKKGLVEKGFSESAAFLESIEAEDSLEYSPINAFVLRRIGTFPIDREHAEGRKFLEDTDQILKSEILGLFMEPHRYKDGTLKYLRTGAAVLARRHSNVPVCLFASSGEPDGPDRLTFLEPFTCAQLQSEYGRKLSPGELTIIMADRINYALPDRPKFKWFGNQREIELRRLKVSANFQ